MSGAHSVRQTSGSREDCAVEQSASGRLTAVEEQSGLTAVEELQSAERRRAARFCCCLYLLCCLQACICLSHLPEKASLPLECRWDRRVFLCEIDQWAFLRKHEDRPVTGGRKKGREILVRVSSQQLSSALRCSCAQTKSEETLFCFISWTQAGCALKCC